MPGIFVDCDARSLTTVPDVNVPRDARTFALTYNQLTAIGDEAFSTLSRLITLRLQQNAISRLGPRAFVGLNRITTLAFLRHTPGLANLRMAYNNIQRIDWEPADQHEGLRSIDLSYNRLAVLENFTGMSVLQSLILSHNRIRTVLAGAFNGSFNVQIRIIDLSKNSIRTIPCLAFVKAVHVVEINLENNRIDFIGQSAFVNQSHFTLRLGNNQLVSLHPSSSLPLLSRNVYFDPNPWRCDCEAVALVGWLQRSGVQRVYCSSPAIFRNRSAYTWIEREYRHSGPDTAP
ncbi:leucine-rich repeat-containing protein 15 [Strongylocentrotus purpuratus]|uniref:Uncharacterized protein n=1 Tax=Strongylocentrotus purpuratus TaxID=7668 RepID=A0A7M7NU71_STRPU|nr:leucine-rich repeat-containing protein 15 [Strongylocentrotus purpuratus]